LTRFVLAWVAMLPWAAAHAHDFWIEPSTFAPVVAQRVDIGLCEGDGFDCRPLPRDERRIVAFDAIGPAGARPVVGLDGHRPAGVARFAPQGDYVLTYRTRRAFTTLDAWGFEQHLREKGLERIATVRRERRESGKEAREAYSRYAKALIRAGNGPSTLLDRTVGMKLELIAESVGVFRLLYEGQPHAGVLVTATARGGDERLEGRTDAEGRARFSLHEGTWLIAAVHMVEAPRHVDADWESFWASLTLEVSPQPARRQSAAAAPRGPRGSAD
jgi:uncharacterized GH25 family protein